MRAAPLLPALAITGSIVAVDMASKAVAEARLASPVALIFGIELDLAYNRGVAFGAFAGLPRGVLILAAGVALLLLGVATLRRPLPVAPLTAGLLFGGALGNLIDRARDGRVTDFLQVGSWPTFNLADTALTLGAALLGLALWRGATAPGGGHGAGA